MAGELAELAVARGMVSRREADEALEAFAVFGGAFDTNLLEIAALNEREMTALLEELHGVKNRVDVVAVGELAAANLLRRAVAEKTRVAPALLHGRTLEIIIGDPRDLQAIDEVAFATSCNVAVNVATEARVAWQLEQLYGVSMPLRLARLMSDDGWRPAPGPTRAPPRTSGAYAVIRPATPIPMEEFDAERDMIDMPIMPIAADLDGSGVPAPLPAAPGLTPVPMPVPTLERRAGLDRRSAPRPDPDDVPEFAVDEQPPPPAAPAKRPSGPVDVSDLLPPIKPVPVPEAVADPITARVPVATHAPAPDAAPDPDPEYAGEPWTGADSLDAAFARVERRDDIPPLLLGYLIHRLERMVIFAVQRGAATGWDARGARLRRETVETISFSLNLPSMMASVCAKGIPFLGALPFDDVEQGLMVKLGGRWPEHVALWPIRVSDRTVALLYGEARTDLDLSIARELAGQVIPRVEQAFLRLILARRAGR